MRPIAVAAVGRAVVVGEQAEAELEGPLLRDFAAVAGQLGRTVGAGLEADWVGCEDGAEEGFAAPPLREDYSCLAAGHHHSAPLVLAGSSVQSARELAVQLVTQQPESAP